MLSAAVTHEDRVLELLRLVLAIRSRDQQPAKPLSDYLTAIIRQTQDLADNPRSFTRQTSPEALHLAAGMLSNELLTRALRGVADPEQISREQATDLLQSMDRSVEAINKPVDFEGAVLSAF